MALLDAFRLEGRTAIVTGGNRGIGRAIADALAEVGADVVIANRDADAGTSAADEIAESHGVETLAVPCDVSEETEVEAMVAATVERFGGVDALVNNAGIVAHGPTEETDAATWHDVIETNLTGAFYCAKHAGREMLRGTGEGGDNGDSDGDEEGDWTETSAATRPTNGTILNVSSMSAFVANYPQRQIAYNASKGGLEGLKVQLASEWAERGIRVNNLAPGYIAAGDTDEEAAFEKEAVQTWHDETLLDDIAPPAALKPIAVYLASDASWYMTGETVVVDGGYTVR